MRLPSVSGKYRIDQFLGGGMAEVYRACDTVLNRPVAFKQLSPAGLADADVRARFLEEARVGAQLAHDNIVRTFDYGETPEPFLVMELLEGESLAARIRAANLGSFRDRARIALEIARALGYLHSLKILHRDIKPDNIHIDAATGRVRLIDFGIAKAAGMNLTQAGFVVGTPFYMAPEQLTGAAIGPATDIYAFGLVVFELLCGRRARPAETVERVLQQILNEPVDCTPLDTSAVPPELSAIIRQATQADPVNRQPGFGPIVAQLEGWLAVSTSPLPPLPLPRRRLGFGRTVALALLAASVCGFAVGLVGVSVARASLPPPHPTHPEAPLADEMVAIAAGYFEFEQQRRQAYSGPFEIDRTEVTNESYAAFCRARHHSLPTGFRPDYPGQPVTGVTIDDARTYCFAQGKHLPTELQWERAARGRHGARFPWGDNPDPSRVNVGADHLVAAQSMREGASAEGVLHLIGNAGEWVDQPRPPSVLALDKFADLLKPPATENEPWYLIKGGSFRRQIAESAADLWLPAPGRYTADDVGFRCAR